MERDAKIAPNNAAIFYQLGMLRYQLGELEKSQAALETAAKLAPQSYDFLMALALIHEERYKLSDDEGQFNAAVNVLEKLNEMRPDDQRARRILIRLLEVRRRKQGGEPGAISE
jgi:cytochrome c-type biogenesis protein CcmH/NrfG